MNPDTATATAIPLPYKEITEKEYDEFLKDAVILKEETCTLSSLCGPHEFSTQIEKSGKIYNLGWGFWNKSSGTEYWYTVSDLLPQPNTKTRYTCLGHNYKESNNDYTHYLGTFNSIEEAKKRIEEMDRLYEYFTVLDVLTDKIVHSVRILKESNL